MTGLLKGEENVCCREPAQAEGKRAKERKDIPAIRLTHTSMPYRRCFRGSIVCELGSFGEDRHFLSL